MGSLGQDVRCGLRIFARSRGFAAVAVGVLGLGIGANSAIFNVLNALVLRELPVRQPERLVQVSGLYRNGSKVPFSFPMFRELERGQRVFSGLFGWSGLAQFNLEIDGTLLEADVRAVTGNFFQELGARPLVGRLIGPEDVGSGPPAQVAVLGYEFWDRRFGRDPRAVGRSIRIEGRLFTIIGVTRKWFTGMAPGESPDVTVPVTAAPRFDLESRSSLWVFVTGRMNTGVTIEQARAQLKSFWPEVLAATVPAQSSGQRRQSFLAMGLEVEPAATGVAAALRSRFGRPLHLLMGIAGLILLVVCANFANLMLARAAARGHEFSTRIALGASPRQIVRQLLVESVLLSAAGGLAALPLAYWASRFLIRFMASGSLAPVVLDVRPDWRVFSFTAVAAVVTGILTGLAPAWRMSREPATLLRRDPRTLGRQPGTLGRALIVAQIALSLVLLHGAGLFLRTLETLRSFDPGFQKTGVLQVGLFPRPEAYEKPDQNSYRRQLIEGVGEIPGVRSAAFSNLPVPAGGLGWRDTVSFRNADSDPGANVLATLAFVSPGFFQTLGIPLVSGRDFDWTDDEGHPRVAIVDRNVAGRLLRSGGIVGQRLRFGVQPEFQDLIVVGVARSARLVDLRNPNAAMIYVPCLQHSMFSARGNLFVRANRSAASAKAVEREIRSRGREYATESKTIEQASEQALLQERATATLSSFFASAALLLAGIGLFGLMSYTVTRRTREIGIRMALGSRRAAILTMVLREALLLVLAGIAIGTPCALAAARLIGRMLFGLSPGDPATLAAVSCALAAAGAIAGFLPALRAMNMDPLAALRED